MFDKQKMCIIVQTNTDVDKNYLILFQHLLDFFWNILGKKRWSKLSQEWVPIVENQLDRKKIDDKPSYSFA
jgi:hypothetical protein